MTKEELIQELIMSKINEARAKKKIRSERSWWGKGDHSFRQEEYQVIMELSGNYPVSLLCRMMEIQRSSFYNWKKGLSDQYAHKCCKQTGIKSIAKHYRYKKPGDPFKVYPNLLLAEVNIDGLLQCIVSDMTAFWVEGIYYELALYMDLWNNEILTYGLSSKRGDCMTYISRLKDLLEMKKQYPDQNMILHSDQGSVYASKKFNELLPMYNITRSMSRAGTPTDNAAMESINGWIKAELFADFYLNSEKEIEQAIAEYIHFFNEECPAYALSEVGYANIIG